LLTGRQSHLVQRRDCSGVSAGVSACCTVPASSRHVLDKTHFHRDICLHIHIARDVIEVRSRRGRRKCIEAEAYVYETEAKYI